MATPTKRRKTNGFKASPQTVGSLDFFFGKQKEEHATRATNEDGSQKTIDGSSRLTHENPTNDVTSQALADEELARKLQLEWDTETRANVEAEELEVKVSSRTEGTEKPASNYVAKEQHLSSNSSPREAERHTEEANTKSAHNFPETLTLQSALSSKDLISSSIPFDESPLKFDPSIYLPDLRRHWATEGGNASYGLLTRCFVLVNSTQSRIKIVDTLVNFLRTIIEGDPQSLLPAVSSIMRILDLITNHIIGLAGYKCNITTLHIIRAWPWRLSYFQSIEKDVWIR